MKHDLRNIDKKLKKPLISDERIRGILIGSIMIIIIIFGLSLFGLQTMNTPLIFENSDVIEDYTFYTSREITNLKILIPDYKKCLIISKPHGCSMYPYSKKEGNWGILDTCVNPKDLITKDVIVFSEGLVDIQHRIIYIDYEEEIIITKGDNNYRPDNPISFDQVMGKIIANFNATHFKEDSNSGCVIH